MKQQLLAIILLLLSSPLMAEWVMVNETGTAIHYIDADHIQRNGDLVRFWQLTETKERARDGSISRRVQLEYDCKAERRRFIYETAYSGTMASGKVIFTQNHSHTGDPIAPGTVGWEFFKVVCLQ
jgi:hypothetical protein